MEIEFQGNFYWMKKGFDEDSKYFRKRCKFVLTHQDRTFDKAVQESHFYANVKLFGIKYDDEVMKRIK